MSTKRKQPALLWNSRIEDIVNDKLKELQSINLDKISNEEIEQFVEAYIRGQIKQREEVVYKNLSVHVETHTPIGFESIIRILTSDGEFSRTPQSKILTNDTISVATINIDHQSIDKNRRVAVVIVMG
jgi:hypothetical protein